MTPTDEDVVIDVDVAEEESVVEGPRRAHLRVSRVDPWSVMKTSFILSLGVGIVVIVAIVLLWMILTAFGVFEAINKTVNDVAGSSTSFDVMELISFGRVFGYSLVLAAFEVVMTSALATLIAAIYNVTSGFTGGFEVTLSED